MKVLVTGGAGFIGSHRVERLLDLNCEVSVIDDLNNFYPPALKQENLSEMRKRGNFQFYECDICDQQQVSRILEQNTPEAILHLGARAGVRPSLKDPLLYERVNVHGTLVLLEAARNVGARRFILGSSSSVYGTASRVPFSEDDCRNQPISPYAATKLAAENMCSVYSHLYGIQVICLRFFTVYGPRQRPDLAIRKFTELMDRGEAIPVFGEGGSSRDYTYIDDIVDGVIAAVSYDCRYEIINLGNSHPIALSTMIQTIENCLEAVA